MSNEFTITETPGRSGQPDPFHALHAEIDRSKRLLDLKPDWDDQGSPSYAMETWRRATTFLGRYADHLLAAHDIVIPTPRINAGPEGSIDVHWKTPRFELLLNFPADPRLPAGFYGDDYGTVSIKGKMRTEALNQGLLFWLMMSTDAAIKKAQAIVARHIPRGASLSKELMAERKREAARD